MLKKWEDKIKKKIIAETLREMIETRASWYPLNLYKNNGLISRYPESSYSPTISTKKDFHTNIDTLTDHGENYDFEKDFFTQFASLLKKVPLPNTTELS